ncbi:MAG: prepilin-type N-terminal cleavage/methylation domain-containing protein [Candidatus Moraniibacteriota bacterium]
MFSKKKVTTGDESTYNTVVSGNQGFTILELIVIIAVVTIVTAMSWSALSGMKNKTNINNACGQVSAMINKTRNYALSGKVAGGFGGSVPESFTITITGGTIQIVSNNPVGLSETFHIPGGVTCASPTWSATYATPNAVGTLPGGGATSIITCSGYGGSRNVEVTPYQAICK